MLGGVSLGHAWEPTKPIEFVIPAGTGGGADQMARLIAGIAEKNKLSPRPLIVVNKAGGAGAEGFLYVKEKRRSARHHHHPVESVHDPAAHWRSVQLERSNSRRPPGARRIRPLGERRGAVQDGQGVPRRGQGQSGGGKRE